MKNIIKLYFPLALTILCTVFAIYFLFHSVGNLSSVFSEHKQTTPSTSIAKEIESLPKEPLPTLKYNGNSLTAGDTTAFDQLFLLQFSDGTTSALKNIEHAAIYLVDVKSQNGTSILTRFSSDTIAAFEEFPSTAVYDTQKHLLYFKNSGIYTFLIRFYYDYRPGILYECQVPVEVR